MMTLLYFAGIAVLLFLALRLCCGDRVMGGAEHGLPVIGLGWASSVFLALTYVVCVVFDLLLPSYAMYEVWAGLLPGFVWLTPAGFAIGLAESFLYGWYFALVFGGLFNAFVGRKAQ
ncbi:MAG: DUF5676 family membrane protein [Maritimibacter harenae]